MNLVHLFGLCIFLVCVCVCVCTIMHAHKHTHTQMTDVLWLGQFFSATQLKKNKMVRGIELRCHFLCKFIMITLWLVAIARWLKKRAHCSQWREKSQYYYLHIYLPNARQCSLNRNSYILGIWCECLIEKSNFCFARLKEIEG